MARGNLKKPRSTGEAREWGKKGGLASGEARRKRKEMREELKELLALPSEGLEGMTEQRAMLVSMLQKAKTGDVSAAAFIRDTIGEKPNDKVDKNLTGGLTISWQD